MIGFSIAAPVGPIGVLCIRRTLTDGRVTGLAVGLGAAAAGAVYGAIAGFGLTAVSSLLVRQQGALRLSFVAVFAGLGIAGAGSWREATVLVTAEVRRRRDASILDQVRTAVDASQPPARLLQPFLFALYKKGLWRTAEQRAELAGRVLERLTRYLEVTPRRRSAHWIASSPVRRMLQGPARPEWDAALERGFLEDLRRARVEYLPAIRLEPTWAIWHVTNAEQARIRRTRQREQRQALTVPDLEATVEEILDPEQELVPRVEGTARAARWGAYLARIAGRGRLGARKAVALTCLYQDHTSQAEAARRAHLDRKTLRAFLAAERPNLTRLARGVDPL